MFNFNILRNIIVRGKKFENVLIKNDISPPHPTHPPSRFRSKSIERTYAYGTRATDIRTDRWKSSIRGTSGEDLHYYNRGVYWWIVTYFNMLFQWWIPFALTFTYCHPERKQGDLLGISLEHMPTMVSRSRENASGRARLSPLLGLHDVPQRDVLSGVENVSFYWIWFVSSRSD